MELNEYTKTVLRTGYAESFNTTNQLTGTNSTSPSNRQYCITSLVLR